MRIRKDYTVSSFDDEIICRTLAEARKKAKLLSKQNEEATINKWVYDFYCDDMVMCENFEILYVNGKEFKGVN